MNLYTITRIKGGVIAWTQEQVAYIIDKYTQENYTLKQLGKEFGCSYGSIKNLLHRNNIKSRGSKQGYPRQSDYFKVIDSKSKAYWLGFLCADGCVHSKNFNISINITDREHLIKFQKAISCPNHKITETIDTRFKNAKPLYQFSIKDKELHTSLVVHGCVPQKSLALTKIPNIPRDYVPHFIRGYFDGDGSLHYLKGTNNFRISFLGTELFLKDIQKELGVENISLAKGTGEAYVLQIAGRKQIMRILKCLYNDANQDIRLDRKYSKYLECSKWAHRH